MIQFRPRLVRVYNTSLAYPLHRADWLTHNQTKANLGRYLMTRMNVSELDKEPHYNIQDLLAVADSNSDGSF